MTRIVVLTGGSTAERNVAFAGAEQVVSSLRRSGYEVRAVDTVEGLLDDAGETRLLKPEVGARAPDPQCLEEWRTREMQTRAVDLKEVTAADLVFLVLHGEQGEGGDIQTALDAAGVRYTGSDATGSANAMDKNTAKTLLRRACIPTPDWVMWAGPDTDMGRLGAPVIVKPSRVGSTLGLSVVNDVSEIEDAVTEALRYDSDVMFETFVSGREFTVGVLGQNSLGVGEIIPEHEIFDYECKYTPGMSQEIFPADIPSQLDEEIRDLALKTHRALELRHFSRVDFKLSADGRVQCLEANTLPGMTRTSLMPQSANVVGIEFETLCTRICDLALK